MKVVVLKKFLYLCCREMRFIVSNMKKTVWALLCVLLVFVVATIGASFYMLDYSLAPDKNRADTDSCYRQLFGNYPETVGWVDSLQRIDALRDTFVTMPEGYRCHAYYVNTGSRRTALVIHGWRDQAIKFFYLARMYEREFGYNVVMPDLYASGQSDGEALRMGWLDRLDMLRWLEVFQTDSMVVHGVSMGGATTMMMSAHPMPDGIKDIRFVDDCGYTSVWDEFAGEMRNRFSLPEFPLMYSTNVICKLRYGWAFDEASAIRQVARCHYPMLFIHGDSDEFVPTSMVYRLYEAKPAPKELWIAPETAHARSYKNHRAEYTKRVGAFIAHPFQGRP